MVPGYIIYDTTDDRGYYFVEDATTNGTNSTNAPSWGNRPIYPDIWLDEDQKESLRRQAFNNFLNVIRARYDAVMLRRYVPVKSKYIMIPTNSILQRWNE